MESRCSEIPSRIREGYMRDPAVSSANSIPDFRYSHQGSIELEVLRPNLGRDISTEDSGGLASSVAGPMEDRDSTDRLLSFYPTG